MWSLAFGPLAFSSLSLLFPVSLSLSSHGSAQSGPFQRPLAEYLPCSRRSHVFIFIQLNYFESVFFKKENHSY